MKMYIKWIYAKRVPLFDNSDLCLLTQCEKLISIYIYQHMVTINIHTRATW